MDRREFLVASAAAVVMAVSPAIVMAEPVEMATSKFADVDFSRCNYVTFVSKDEYDWLRSGGRNDEVFSFTDASVLRGNPTFPRGACGYMGGVIFYPRLSFDTGQFDGLECASDLMTA